MTTTDHSRIVERLSMLAKIIEHLPTGERDAVEPAFLFLLAELARQDIIQSDAAKTIAAIATTMPIIERRRLGRESSE